jgi:hypothetical protein
MGDGARGIDRAREGEGEGRQGYMQRTIETNYFYSMRMKIAIYVRFRGFARALLARFTIERFYRSLESSREEWRIISRVIWRGCI